MELNAKPPQGRRQSKRNSCEHASDGGKRKHPSIHLQVTQSRHRSLAGGNNKAPSRIRKKQAKNPAERCKQNAFRKELLNHPGAAAAQSASDSNFFLPAND